jgi:hypothetical protein
MQEKFPYSTVNTFQTQHDCVQEILLQVLIAVKIGITWITGLIKNPDMSLRIVSSMLNLLKRTWTLQFK